jgi:RNA polymerase sigma factor (sigma-70 family)
MSKKIHVSTGAIVTDVASTIRYMQEVKKTPLLSRSQETELGQLAKSGDRVAINRLVESNLRFAIQVSKQYQGMGLQLEDLIGFANIGLFEAAERFNPDRGVKFITFAVWYIRAELQKALNDLSRTVRIPSHRVKTEEYSTKSISTPVGDDDNKETYADRYLASDATKSARDLTDLTDDLQRALNHLKPKQRAAISRFYGVGFEYAQCMDQIAEELDVTGERARQLVRQAELDLAKVPGIELLAQYL